VWNNSSLTFLIFTAKQDFNENDIMIGDEIAADEKYTKEWK